jgi:hypothetical protein
MLTADLVICTHIQHLMDVIWLMAYATRTCTYNDDLGKGSASEYLGDKDQFLTQTKRVKLPSSFRVIDEVLLELSEWVGVV